MNMLKRTIAMLLVLCMVIGLVPSVASVASAAESHLNSKPADGTVTGQPFNTAVSANYRIPGLVNHNGTLIATADARWDNEKDGGGMDLVVSRSTDGNTWNYTFAGYLGDNGNVYNANSSTLMDPVIISDGTTLYLLADMYPAGYSISDSSTANVFSDTAIGFDASGNLLLSDDNRSTYGYYLQGGKIYSTAGEEQTGYTVQGWYDLYQDGTYVTNLFFADSPFQLRATSYICMSTSTDGGVTWNAPTLLNVKPEGVNWMVLGPGSGVYTQDGDLAFTTYDNSNIYLIWGNSTDGWNHVVTSAATNENSIIELEDGTIRAFVKRKGNNKIAYVDFTKTDSGYTAQSLVDTGVANFSQCMVSSLYYSKTLNGKDVVLVCCPSKPGSGDWNGRFNGKIHMFTLDDSNAMTLVNSYAINGESEFFAYSNMAEMDDGTIALLYEDDCISYSAGGYTGTASHITYKNVNLETAFGVKFDIEQDLFALGANNSIGYVRVPTTAGVEHVHVQEAEVSSLAVNYDAYEIVLCKDTETACTANFTCTNIHEDAATVTLTLTDDMKAETAIKAFIVEDDGTVNSIYDVERDGDDVTFVAPHFSVVGVAAMTDDEIAQQNAVNVTVYVGETKTLTSTESVTPSSHTSDAADVTWAAAEVETQVYKGIQGTANGFDGSQVDLSSCLYTFTSTDTEGWYTITAQTSDGTAVYVNPHGVNGKPNVAGTSAVAVEVLQGVDSDHVKLKVADGSLHFHAEQANPYWNWCTTDTSGNCNVLMLYRPVEGNETSSEEIPGYVQIAGKDAIESGSRYLIVGMSTAGNYYVMYPTTDNSTNRTHMAKVSEVTGTVTGTAITITGNAVGTTSVDIGGTRYNITVEQLQQDVTLYVGETKSFTIEGQSYSDADVTDRPESSIATLDSVVGTIIAGTKDKVEITSADDLEADKQYLIVNNRAATGTPDACVLTDQDNAGGLNTTGPVDANSTELWTITPVTGGYTISRNGSYVTFSSGAASMNGDATTALTMEYTSTTYGTGWLISLGSNYLSDHGGNSYSYAKGYNERNDAGNYWTIYEIVTEGAATYTDVTFTGVTKGNTTAVVGNTKFNITVEQDEEDVTLYVQETKTFTDDTGNYENSATIDNTAVAEMNVNGVDTTEKTMTQVLSADGFAEGKRYLIVSERSDTEGLLTGTPYTATISWSSLVINGLNTHGTVSEDSTEIWSIIPTGNGTYYVKYGDKYLTLDYGTTSTASLTDTATELTLTDNGDNWYIKNGDGDYLSNVGGFDSNYYGASGFNETGGSSWKFYEVTGGNPLTEISFTGVGEGFTTATVGGTRYNITVSYHKESLQFYAGNTQNVPAPGTVTDAELEAFNTANGSIVSVAREADGSLTFTGVGKGEVTAALGNTKYTFDILGYDNEVDVTLAVGETMPYTETSGNYADASGNVLPSDTVADMTMTGGMEVQEAVTSITAGKYVIYTYKGAYVVNRADGNYIDLSTTEQTVWNVAVADSAAGTYYVTDSDGNYLYVNNGTAGVTNTQTAVKLVYGTGADGEAEQGFYIKDAAGSCNLNNSGGTNNAYGKSPATGSWSIWQFKPVEEYTDIVFTGTGLGNTTAIVGNTKFNIAVTHYVENITLKVDETKTFTIDGEAYTDADVTVDPNTNIATIDSVVGTTVGGTQVAGEKVTAIQSGKQYLIVNTRAAKTLTNASATSGAAAGSGTGLSLNGTTANIEAAAIWTIEGADGTYTAKDANGNYLTIGANSASVGTSAANLGITYGGTTWTIDQDSYYLNDFGALGTCAAGWKGDGAADDAGSQWDIYEVVTTGGDSSTEVTFTGKAEGTTTATVGNTKFNITVETNKINITLYEGGKKTVTIADVEYSDADVTKDPDESSAKLVSVVANTEQIKQMTPVTSADGLVGGKQYLIVNKRTTTSGDAGYDPNHSVMTGTAGEFNGTAGLQMDGPVTAYNPALWSITPSGSGYTVTMDGKYLYMEGNAASLVDTEQVLTLTYDTTNSGWLISKDGLYLSDWNGVSSELAHAYNVASDGGNYWTIYEVAVTDETYSTDVTFEGVTAGTTTTATIGAVTYNITVLPEVVRDITLYVGVTTTDTIADYVYDNPDSEQPDNTYAYIHSVSAKGGTDTEVVFSGITEGVTTAKVGHVTYNITVVNLNGGGVIPDFDSIVGEGEYTDGNTSNLNMTGKEIKSLRITAGSQFPLAVAIVPDEIEWTSADSKIATVDPDTGVVTAVSEGQTLVTATVIKDGVEDAISIPVTVVPAMVSEGEESAFVFYYIDEVYNTDPYYTLFISSESTTGPAPGHEMVMVSEGEVIWLERPKSAAMGMVWTSDPWDGHALTYMNSTGSAGQYYPLKNADGEVGVGTVNGVTYYKCTRTDTHYGCPYHNIVNAGNGANASWSAGLDELLEYNVHIGEDFWQQPGCDGVMSMSRNANDNTPSMVTSMTFISEKLPEVGKAVYGTLGTSGLKQDWTPYQEGMYAEVGEHVYFEITITQEAPHAWKMNDGDILSDNRGQLAALEYLNAASLTDWLMDADSNPMTDMTDPPYFYTKDLDAQDGDLDGDGNADNDGYIKSADLRNNVQGVLNDLNAGWTEEERDAGQRVLTYYVVYQIKPEDANTSITNGVAMDYTYSSAYSSGTTEARGIADATMHILGTSLGDVVVDFGLPVVLDGLTAANLADKFHEANTNAAIGGAKYGRVEITDNNNGTWDVTYIPESIIQGYDVIYLMDENNQLVNYFRVYPATTVFYEENFVAQEDTGWSQTGSASGRTQLYEALGRKDQPFGFDAVYASDLNGSSNSYAAAKAVGTASTFTFTGTGFDLYANCDAESGYVAVTLYKLDADGEVASRVALYTVNTKVKVGDTPATAGQGEDEYHMPIISVTDLDHGSYKVEVRKILNPEREIRIDGVRIYNTIEDSNIFLSDKEDAPVFFELRDYVLKALNIQYSEQYGSSAGEIADQIYNYITDENTDAEAPAISAMVLDSGVKTETFVRTTTTTTTYQDGGSSVKVVVTQVYKDSSGETPEEREQLVSETITYTNADGTTTEEENTSEVVSTDTKVEDGASTESTTTAQDLLDNSPKNELFLYPGQTLAFKVKTSRMMQLGLKAPVGKSTTYTVSVDNTPVIGTTDAPATMASSVDMFYNLPAAVNIADQATITTTSTNEHPTEGSANMVDGDASTLYKFYNDAMDGEQSIILTYAEPRTMNTLAIAFENVGASDGNGFAFTYSILARNGDGEYDTIVDHATANRTNNSYQRYSFQEKTYSEVKIVMHSCTTNDGNGWPAIAEFEVYRGVVEHTVTVTNTGDNILSVTKLKVCDDPGVRIVPLTVKDIEQVLLTAGYAEPDEEAAPTDPSEPEETKPAETKPEETKPEEVKPTEPKPTEPKPTEPEDTGCAKDKTCVLSKYSDIVTDDWYHDGIHFCVEEGLMNGMSDTTFAPNEATTRAQLVTILYRLMGMPKNDGKTEPFTDVAEGDWYYDAVCWAYSENIVKGTSATTFAPNANVTREQVATILHRFLITPEATGKLDSFGDAASVSDYAKDALAWAVGEGMINGVAQHDGTSKLDPAGNATRAQIATILYRYLINA